MQRLEPAGPGIIDLGALTPPLLFFGGPYSNLHATAALIGRATDLGIPPSSCICTGDIVAYGAHPQETAEAIRDFGCHVVRGNCEEAFAARTDDCGCGFSEGSRCDVLSAQWMDHAQRHLSAEICDWMGALPTGIRFTVQDTTFFATHGAPSQVNRFVFRSTDRAVKNAEFETTGAHVMIAGHCGLPFSDAMGPRLWHNPGVIGLPANDGTPRTWYSTLRQTAGGLQIDTQSLEYDVAGAQAAMRRVGLPEAYAATLSSGLWDNCDVLPDEETQTQGRPLSATTVAAPRGAPALAAATA